MTDVVAVAMISAIPGSLAVILSFLNNVIARRNAVHIEQTKADMETLTTQTNSKMDALLKVTGEAEFAKGVKEGGRI